MLQDAANTACEQVTDGSTVSKVMQKLQEAYKDYIDTITLLGDAEGWEKDKLAELKSGTQDLGRAAKADIKRMEKELKGRTAQRRLDHRAAMLTKLQWEAAEAQWDQNSEKLEELSTLMNEESKELADWALYFSGHFIMTWVSLSK